MPPTPPTTIPEFLARELDLLVARLRDFSPARYAAPATPFASRAGALWHLAEYLVAAAGVDRRLPVLPDMAVADVVAVTGHDLCVALAFAPEPAQRLATAGALAEVLLHRYGIDGAMPGRRASAAALAVLEPAALDPRGVAGPGQLLRVARLRCSAYR
ncbi:MAG: hypothetical protein ABJC62_12910 [Frankiaceae bacterium]